MDQQGMDQQVPPSSPAEHDILISLWVQSLGPSPANQTAPSSRSVDTAELARRVRILDMGARSIEPQHFQMLLTALLQRRPMRILYHGRSRDETSERIVSPQRMVRYRGNWYLDTWCHWRQELRHFAVDRIHPLEVLEEPAREIADAELDGHFAAGYGIFSGAARATAKLRFSPDAARWIADEIWHPQQQKRILRDGSVELSVPYSNNRELIMDILRYGPDCEVLEPVGLRDRVAQLAARTAALYRQRRPHAG